MRRVDARRNVDTIVAAAARLLAHDPRSSIADIARVAGLHRATVHRHFPTREDLVAAVRARWYVDAERAVEEARPEVGPPELALRRITQAVLEGVGDRYRVARFAPVLDPAQETRRATIRARVARLVARGQRSGAFRTDLSPEILATAWEGLVTTIGADVSTGVPAASSVADCISTLLKAPSA